jgi:DNA invertase Pin-like site-specific DNA recombinase
LSSAACISSLTEKIETGSASGKLQFHVFAALAEFERGLIRERTQAGWQQPAPVAGPVAASRS